jgi:hypothetical protein
MRIQELSQRECHPRDGSAVSKPHTAFVLVRLLTPAARRARLFKRVPDLCVTLL